MPRIRLNTVGRAQGGSYDGWYIVILPKTTAQAESYTLYQSTEPTFAFDPSARTCYDTWLDSYESLARHVVQHFPDIVWDEQLPPPRFATDPRLTRLAARFRERTRRTNQES
jgi:hypothetical protein